jgi:hypothetical protein
MNARKGVAAIVDGRYEVTVDFDGPSESTGEIHGLNEGFVDHKLDSRVPVHMKTADGSFDQKVSIHKATTSGPYSTPVTVAYFRTCWL